MIGQGHCLFVRRASRWAIFGETVTLCVVLVFRARGLGNDFAHARARARSLGVA